MKKAVIVVLFFIGASCMACAGESGALEGPERVVLSGPVAYSAPVVQPNPAQSTMGAVQSGTVWLLRLPSRSLRWIGDTGRSSSWFVANVLEAPAGFIEGGD